MRQTFLKLALTLTMFLMAALCAVADTIYLKDGRTVQGTVLGFINGRFAIRVGTASLPLITAAL